MIMKSVTIRDVAKAAGVSIATVSYVLKGIGKVSEPTIKRVWDVVNELNYSPNPYAKKLFSKEPATREKTGILMRVSYWPSASPITEQIEKDLLYHFDAACRAHDCIATSYLYRHELGFHCRQIVNNLVDGVVLCTAHKDVIKRTSGKLPAVLVDVAVDPVEVGMPVVTMDFEEGWIQILKTLEQRGLSGKMAIICGVQHQSPFESNHFSSNSGLIYKVAERCGLQIAPEHDFTVETSPDTSQKDSDEIAKKLVKLIREDGVKVICAQFFSVIDLAASLKKFGIRMPEDAVIVAGSFQQVSIPGVIVLVNDFQPLLEKAVNVLSMHINDPAMENKIYRVPFRRIDYSNISPDEGLEQLSGLTEYTTNKT